MRVSPETIYQALYVQGREGLKSEVREALRTGRTRRKSTGTPKYASAVFPGPMTNISERPAAIEDRAVPRGNGRGFDNRCLQSIGDRDPGGSTTGYVMSEHLPVGHTTESVRDRLIKTTGTVRAHLGDLSLGT
jgi:IS30 family transposase